MPTARPDLPAPTATAQPATVQDVPATQAPTSAPVAPVATVAPTTAPGADQEPTATPIATEAEFFLQLVEPAEPEVITAESTIEVIGRTRVDAVITVNDTLVEPDGEGVFTAEVELEEGPNFVEIVSSVASGEQADIVLVVIYVP